METRIKVVGIEIGKIKTKPSSPIIFEIDTALDFINFVEKYGLNNKSEEIDKIKKRVRGVLMLNSKSNKRNVDFYDKRFNNRNLKTINENHFLEEVRINESAISI